MYAIVLLHLSLLPVTYIGDTILFKCNIEIIKALDDNITHGIIGLITWWIVYLRTPAVNRIFSRISYELALAYFFASAIDVDHFLLARSLSLDAATKLGNRRPLLHCTTLWLAIVAFIVVLAQIVNSGWILRLAWLIFGSVISHHLRDGTRRGLWLAPFGSTRPIPYSLYLVLLISLPDVTAELLKYTQHHLISGSLSHKILEV